MTIIKNKQNNVAFIGDYKQASTLSVRREVSESPPTTRHSPRPHRSSRTADSPRRKHSASD